jgi:hypothetical protein
VEETWKSEIGREVGVETGLGNELLGPDAERRKE